MAYQITIVDNNITVSMSNVGPQGPMGPAGLLTATSSVAIDCNAATTALRITQLGVGDVLRVEDNTNPDSTPTVIDASGKLIVGHTATVAMQASSYLTQFLAQSSNYPLAIGYTAPAATGPKLTFAKNRSADWSTQTVIVAGDTLGEIDFMGSDGTSIIPGARIGAYSSATPGSNDMPGTIKFWTTPDGQASPVERMSVSHNGGVGIGAGLGAMAERSLWINRAKTGAATFYDYSVEGTIQADVQTAYYGNLTFVGTAAAAFTLSSLIHFCAGQNVIGAGSAVISQFGFRSESALVGATANYGFWAGNTAAVGAGKTAYGFFSSVNLPSGGGTAWGFYSAGTADNYFLGYTRFGGDVLLVGATSALGYGTGAGGAVTQLTSKATPVTLDKASGRVTMANTALAANTAATFILNNNRVAATDVAIVNLSSGVASSANYRVEVENTAAGLIRIRVTNISAGSLSEALVLNFAVIKGVAA